MLAAACMMLGCAGAMAQTAAPAFPDPLAPKLTLDPRTAPRFQKFARPEQAQLGPPTVFVPPPSAAGNTGFDSTNARKAKTKAKPRAAVRTVAPAAPAPVAVSPYQKPALPAAKRAYAAAPGGPPVQLGPIRQPLKKRKAHVEPDDPYAALGMHAGGFTLYPAVEVIGGYDSNPSRANGGGKAASLYAVAPELRAQSNWSRHELKADLRGSYTGYSPDSTPPLSRPYANGKVIGRVDVTKTTRIDLGGRVLVNTDTPGSPNLQAGLAKRPIYTTFGGTAGLGQRFNRFDVSVRGDAERTVYQQSVLTDGSTSSNADRNYNQYTGAVRGGYELTPGVTPFAEVSADTRVRDLNTDQSGYQRGSRGLTAKVGSTFELSRLLSGEVALGYTRRDYQDARLPQLSGLIGNASLVWTVNALTTVKFVAASTIGESTISGVSGIFYRDAGLQIDHAFRRWLIGSVKLGVGLDSYKGSDIGGGAAALCNCVVSAPGGTAADRVDQRFSAGLGLTYKLNRSAQIKGEFRQDWLRSNVTGVDYSASVFLLGLRLQE